MEQKQNSITTVEDNNVQPHLHKTQCCVQPFTCRKDAVSELYNMDCIQGMKHYPDKYFDLAICDPPYGMPKFIFGSGKDGVKSQFENKQNIHRKWDIKPSKNYFTELQRVSKNQIIWGGNHINSIISLDSSCWLVWDKDNTGDFADCELAWTSFNTAARIFKYRWNGMLQQNMKNKEKRIHPCHKPIALYEWILSKYAEKGQRILDTHLGSGSSRIACYLNGFDFVGFEIDKQYCEASEKRFVNAISQQRLSF